MDENNEAQDTVCEILKVFKPLSWELHLCDYNVLSKSHKRENQKATWHSQRSQN